MLCYGVLKHWDLKEDNSSFQKPDTDHCWQKLNPQEQTIRNRSEHLKFPMHPITFHRKIYLFSSLENPVAHPPTTRQIPSGFAVRLICFTIGLQCPIQSMRSLAEISSLTWFGWLDFLLGDDVLMGSTGLWASSGGRSPITLQTRLIRSINLL